MKPKAKRINISLPTDVYKKLSALAKKEKRTIAATISVLLNS